MLSGTILSLAVAVTARAQPQDLVQPLAVTGQMGGSGGEHRTRGHRWAQALRYVDEHMLPQLKDPAPRHWPGDAEPARRLVHHRIRPG